MMQDLDVWKCNFTRLFFRWKKLPLEFELRPQGGRVVKALAFQQSPVQTRMVMICSLVFAYFCVCVCVVFYVVICVLSLK